MLKIGLLTSDSLSEFRLKTLSSILKDEKFSIRLALIDNRPGKNLKEKLKHHIKKGRGGYIIVMALESIFSKKSKEYSIIKFCQDNNITAIKTNDPYSDDTISTVADFNLDILILAGGFGIIKEPLFKVTRIGILSYHHGDMRKYRGMPPAFWELYNNEDEMGITVQILSLGLDRGIPIEEKKIKIQKNDSLKALQNRAFDQSVDMLYNALKKVSDTNFETLKIDKFGKVYTLPNLRQWLTLHFKVMYRKVRYFKINNSN